MVYAVYTQVLIQTLCGCRDYFVVVVVSDAVVVIVL
jgi:hypothetical protein